MATTRLGQGAKFFRADELRDQHGRLQSAPPIVLGPMTPGVGPVANPSSLAKLTELAKKPLSVQVGAPGGAVVADTYCTVACLCRTRRCHHATELA